MDTDQPQISLIPLTPAVFSILIALSDGEKHGYEIMKRVKQDSQGQVKMGTGTLYGSLKRMLADGLIEEAGERPAPALDDERRRYYRLTELGQRALRGRVAALCTGGGRRPAAPPAAAPLPGLGR